MSRPSEMSLRVIGVDGTAERLLASCAARGPGRPDPADCGWGYRALVSWSPDSSRVAFSRGRGIAVATLATGAIRSITRCPGQCADVAPAWSPTGQRIAFVRNDAIFTVRPDGSRLTRLAAGLASSLAWSPDGASFVFDSPAGLSTINDDGTGEKSLVLWGSFGAGPGLPSWSPDGRRIAYFQTPGEPGKFRSEVWVMNADGTGRTRLYEGVCCVGTWARPVWSPSGREIAFADTSYDGELAGGTFSVRVADRHLQRLAPADAAPDLVAWQPVPGP